MTRLECEKKLLALAEEMMATYQAYSPMGDFLSVSMTGGYICINDAFFTNEHRLVDDVHGDMFKTVYVVKYQDGTVRYGNGKEDQACA